MIQTFNYPSASASLDIKQQVWIISMDLWPTLMGILMGLRSAGARLVRQGNTLNYLSLWATSQEYFWPWANVKSPEPRQITQLPRIKEGIIILDHVGWEPINISLCLSFLLSKTQLDWVEQRAGKSKLDLCWSRGKSRNN